MVVLSPLGLALKGPALASTVLEYPKIEQLLHNASPFGARVLVDHEKAPVEFQLSVGRMKVSKSDPARWLRGKTETDLISACETMIHETMHGLCRLLACDASEEAATRRGSLIVRPEIGHDLLVLATPTFPSREFASSAIKELQNSYRFKTYIASDQPTLGTQVNGIYGLLDEFNAYYAGARTGCELIEHFLKTPSALGSGSAWAFQLASVGQSLVPHQEFRGYILSYLAYAEQHHAEAYRLVLKEGGFVQGFRSVDAAYSSLSKKFTSNLTARIAGLQKQKISISLSGENIWSGNKGRVYPREQYLQLDRAIKKSPALQA